MRMPSRLMTCGLVAAGVLWSAAATATPLPASALASNRHAAPVEVDRRWYEDDDDYYYPPEYYLPPPPVVRVVPTPPVVVYEPPVYGWISPPRPSNCGKYRYWNGERCADARYDPPYIGPRW